MPLFECEICGVVENTALGTYWGRRLGLYAPPFDGKALCSQCTPEVYSDGKPTRKGGKWHGKFPRQTVAEYLADYPNSEVWRSPLSTHKEGNNS